LNGIIIDPNKILKAAIRMVTVMDLNKYMALCWRRAVPQVNKVSCQYTAWCKYTQCASSCEAANSLKHQYHRWHNYTTDNAVYWCMYKIYVNGFRLLWSVASY